MARPSRPGVFVSKCFQTVSKKHPVPETSPPVRIARLAWTCRDASRPAPTRRKTPNENNRPRRWHCRLLSTPWYARFPARPRRVATAGVAWLIQSKAPASPRRGRPTARSARAGSTPMPRAAAAPAQGAAPATAATVRPSWTAALPHSANAAALRPVRSSPAASDRSPPARDGQPFFNHETFPCPEPPSTYSRRCCSPCSPLHARKIVIGGARPDKA